MNRFNISILMLVLSGLAWIDCTPVDGDSSDAGGGALGGTTSGGASAFGGTQATGTGGSGGGTAGTFSCGGTTMCTTGEQACRRAMPGVPEEPIGYACVPFPSGCTARDCSCFCTDAGGDYPTRFPCAILEGCTCSGQNGRIQVGCLGE